MQWQTVEDAKAKDKIERAGCQQSREPSKALSQTVGGIVRYCDISVFTDDGWSEPIRREVLFISGRELNGAEQGWKCQLSSTYALIRLGGRIATIELQPSYTTAIGGFAASDFERLFSFNHSVTGIQVGPDLPGQMWTIAKAR